MHSGLYGKTGGLASILGLTHSVVWLLFSGAYLCSTFPFPFFRSIQLKQLVEWTFIPQWCLGDCHYAPYQQEVQEFQQLHLGIRPVTPC